MAVSQWIPRPNRKVVGLNSYYDIVISDIVNEESLLNYSRYMNESRDKRRKETALAKMKVDHLLEKVLRWEPFHHLS